MHTSIGAKLFIDKLDYCLIVDERSTNAIKMGYVCVFALNFHYNVRRAIKICDRLWEKGHFRAYFQNRVIDTAGYMYV